MVWQTSRHKIALRLNYFSLKNDATNHVVRKFGTGQIFDVFMSEVDNVCQLHSINNLLVNVHLNSFNEFVIPTTHIGSDNFGDDRSPEANIFSR